MEIFKNFNKVILLLTLLFTAISNADEVRILPIDFDLAQLNSQNKNNRPDSMDLSKGNISNLIKDPRFLSKMGPVAQIKELQPNSIGGKNRYKTYYVFPLPNEADLKSYEGSKFLGMSQKEALRASRDDRSSSACSAVHDQGDLANRWCHSTLSRNLADFLQRKGASPLLANAAGAFLWVPKEYFYDLNPSSGDLVVTYKDSLGTKRSTFEVSIFGDAVFKGERASGALRPFKNSTPFVTFKRSLGGSAR